MFFLILITIHSFLSSMQEVNLIPTLPYSCLTSDGNYVFLNRTNKILDAFLEKNEIFENSSEKCILFSITLQEWDVLNTCYKEPKKNLTSGDIVAALEAWNHFNFFPTEKSNKIEEILEEKAWKILKKKDLRDKGYISPLLQKIKNFFLTAKYIKKTKNSFLFFQPKEYVYQKTAYPSLDFNKDTKEVFYKKNEINIVVCKQKNEKDNIKICFSTDGKCITYVIFKKEEDECMTYQYFVYDCINNKNIVLPENCLVYKKLKNSYVLFQIDALDFFFTALHNKIYFDFNILGEYRNAIEINSILIGYEHNLEIKKTCQVTKENRNNSIRKIFISKEHNKKLIILRKNSNEIYQLPTKTIINNIQQSVFEEETKLYISKLFYGFISFLIIMTCNELLKHENLDKAS